MKNQKAQTTFLGSVSAALTIFSGNKASLSSEEVKSTLDDARKTTESLKTAIANAALVQSETEQVLAKAREANRPKR